jgi:hypothetical protein
MQPIAARAHLLDPIFRRLAIDVMMAGLAWNRMRHRDDPAIAQRIDVVVDFGFDDVFGDLTVPNQVDRHDVWGGEDIMLRDRPIGTAGIERTRHQYSPRIGRRALC